MHIEDNLRAGMIAAEARRQALIKLGGVEQTKEMVRERRGPPVLEVLLQDLRFGVRVLLKNPGFTAVAVLTLALGIGANTAIFSVVNSVLLRRCPIRPRSHRRHLAETPARRPRPFLNLGIPKLGERDASLRKSLAATGTGFTLTSAGEPEMYMGLLATPSIFSVLGVKAALGRTFSAEEAQVGQDHVMLLSDGLWKERFGSDPASWGKP